MELFSGEFDDDNDVITVKCDFLANSDAQGCMVVLLGESNNLTVNITRDETISVCTVVVDAFNETFHTVLGFDIESDGSVYDIGVPGVVLMASDTDNTALTCTSESDSDEVITTFTTNSSELYL